MEIYKNLFIAAQIQQRWLILCYTLINKVHKLANECLYIKKKRNSSKIKLIKSVSKIVQYKSEID